jgi:hypothetical protein
MNKFKKITNQELLEELKQRSVDFTQDEVIVLLSILFPHQEKIMERLQELNPQVHN